MQIIRRQGLELPTEISDFVVQAIVNHGRWVVPCPWCAGAQMASREDHRFFCTECLNARIEGKWATVQWPEGHEDIAYALAMRPEKQNRNWLTHETLGDLLRENQTHEVM